MMATVHQPASFQVRKFVYELNDSVPPPCFEYQREHQEEYSISTGLATMVTKNSEDAVNCGLMLYFGIEFTPREGAEEDSQRLKQFELDCEAFFLIRRDIPKTFIDRAFIENCFALLYGTVRGLAISLTGTLQGGPVVLPAIVMDPLLDKIEDLDETISRLQAQLFVEAGPKKKTRKKKSSAADSAVPE